MCYLHRPGHGVNSCKVMQKQDKSAKSTWLAICGGGAGRVRFQVAEKRLAEVQYLNALVTSAVQEFLKQNKHARSTATQDSGLEKEPDKFNLKNLSIGEE